MGFYETQIPCIFPLLQIVKPLYRKYPIYIASLTALAVISLAYLATDVWELSQANYGRKGFYLSYFIGVVLLILTYAQQKARPKQFALQKSRSAYFVIGLIGVFSGIQWNYAHVMMGEPVMWVKISLLLFTAAGLILDAPIKWSVNLKMSAVVLLGITAVLNVYFVFILIPYYIIGVMMVWHYGVSILVFVPLFLLFHVWRIAQAVGKTNLWYRYGFFAGVGLSFAIALIYLLQWREAVTQWQDVIAESQLKAEEHPYPEWLIQAQQIRPNSMQTVLLTATTFGDGFMRSMARPQGEDIRKLTRSGDNPLVHNPLWVVSDWIKPIPEIPEGQLEQLKELYGVSKTRNGPVDQVVQNIEVHHRTHLVRHNIRFEVGTRTQTGKQWVTWNITAPLHARLLGFSLKSASDSVVGEKAAALVRTDSTQGILEWKGGGTYQVSARTSTSRRWYQVEWVYPLGVSNSLLSLRSIQLDMGSNKPVFLTEVKTLGGSVAGSLKSVFFEQPWDNELTYSGNEEWQIQFPVLADTSAPSFDLNNYERVVLDANASWSRDFYESVLEWIPADIPVFISLRSLQEVQPTLQDAFYLEAIKRRFELLPLSQIVHSDKTLILTKGQECVPTMKLLEGSGYFKKWMNHPNINSSHADILLVGNPLPGYFYTVTALGSGEIWTATAPISEAGVSICNFAIRSDSVDYGKLRADVWQRILSTQNQWFDSKPAGVGSNHFENWNSYKADRQWVIVD